MIEEHYHQWKGQPAIRQERHLNKAKQEVLVKIGPGLQWWRRKWYRNGIKKKLAIPKGKNLTR